MEKIRILIADDHPPFREGLRRLLDQEADIEVVGIAADGEEAVKLATKLAPDVAIIDVSMTKINGIEAARAIKKAHPAVAILMLSAFDYEVYVLASLRVGVAGYLMKSSPVNNIIAAIRMSYKGEAIFDYKSVSKMLLRLAAEKGERRTLFVELFTRELEILRLAAKGMSNRVIGQQLDISERTVQTHMVNIFRKLNVSSRTEAVLHALREGWLTMSDLP